MAERRQRIRMHAHHRVHPTDTFELCHYGVKLLKIKL